MKRIGWLLFAFLMTSFAGAHLAQGKLWWAAGDLLAVLIAVVFDEGRRADPR